MMDKMLADMGMDMDMNMSQLSSSMQRSSTSSTSTSSMGERLVPLQRTNWSFFEQQKKVFNDVCKDMGHDWAYFDTELAKMRKDMFVLKAPDFNDFGASFIRPENPSVSDHEGNKRLSLRFDCKDYNPEEISVKTINNQLSVHAKHVEESPGRKISREFSRQYTLPQKIDPPD